jgi:hypothetical protein
MSLQRFQEVERKLSVKLLVRFEQTVSFKAISTVLQRCIFVSRARPKIPGICLILRFTQQPDSVQNKITLRADVRTTSGCCCNTSLYDTAKGFEAWASIHGLPTLTKSQQERGEESNSECLESVSQDFCSLATVILNMAVKRAIRI